VENCGVGINPDGFEKGMGKIIFHFPLSIFN